MLSFLIGGLFFLQSCSKSEDGPVVPVISKTGLQTAIASATNILSTSVEGSAQNQYVVGSKVVLQTSLDLATGILNNAASTQTMLDNAVIALNASLTEFATKVIVPIDPTNLVGQWTFDDGSGTVLKDFSGNSFNGKLEVVTGWGGSLPTWTTDRYGNANKALAFDKGSKITIPYNAKINPATMSISLWVKLAEKRNNKIIGLYAWNGFKFEVQDGNKSFFTGATMGPETIYDRDFAGANPLELTTWYNLAVTFGGGHTIFYINGVKVQDWDNTPGTLRTIAGHDLVFGVDCDKYAAVDTNYDIDHIIPLAWGGYLHGSLDEVRIYKSILSDSQVKSIYDAEKVPVK
jgi:hypothetical protein